MVPCNIFNPTVLQVLFKGYSFGNEWTILPRNYPEEL